ncbi:MAG: hypothetical protein M0C28_07915 [Candidatus Moduliflexus flocculans]|nr:hypothetical protein [Candidatus Moduliflexus flocculans]
MGASHSPRRARTRPPCAWWSRQPGRPPHAPAPRRALSRIRPPASPPVTVGAGPLSSAAARPHPGRGE